jgi:hypothetical protein
MLTAVSASWPERSFGFFHYFVAANHRYRITLVKLTKGENMERKQVMEMFNRESRIGALATSNQKGDVNVAVFGSPRMISEDTVIMAIGDNRSLQYLQENPKASFIVVEPGETPAEWKGARIYIEVESFERYGEVLDSFRSNIRKIAGDKSADAIIAAIRFKINDVRPLIAPKDDAA